jgi:hypothetical protein
MQIGLTKATGPTLLPAAFAERVEPKPAAGGAVDLGEVQALRYRDLKVSGHKDPVTVYAAPTTSGVVTMACEGAGIAASCERVAATIALKGAKALPVVADERYAQGLRKVLGDLEGKRSAARKALAGASTGAAQANAAGRLSSAYSAAAKAAGALRPGPREAAASAALVGALKRAGVGYARVASAARSGNRGGYASGRAAAAAGEAALARALAGFRRLGYKVG